MVEHGPQVCVALATASLIYCYAGYPGVKALTFSRRLGQDADRRVGETAQFVLAVMAPGSPDPCGRGIRKIQKVRLLHAAIRHLVTGSGRWDVTADGEPICQVDLGRHAVHDHARDHDPRVEHTLKTLASFAGTFMVIRAHRSPHDRCAMCHRRPG